jgi:phosphoglycolate phosphatase-like HAD superfamily hydrolase
VGFDASEPTAHNRGKPQAIARIRQRNPYNTVVMIGDGITDLEAVEAGLLALVLCSCLWGWAGAGAGAGAGGLGGQRGGARRGDRAAVGLGVCA